MIEIGPELAKLLICLTGIGAMCFIMWLCMRDD